MNTDSSTQFAFTRINYLLMIIGMALVVVGFFLMSGGGSDDPNVFSEEVFSPMRISVAPILILIGYGAVLYGIFRKPVKSE